MEKYIIFGGNGFLGRYLAEALLKRGKNVLICDKRKSKLSIYDKVNFLKVDITNFKDLEKIPYDKDDIVINLAANQYHLKVPRKNRNEFFFDVNYKGTENILKSMRNTECCKLIYFSTDMTYGKPQYLPVDTKHPQNPFGPYGASKKASEGLCYLYRDKGFNITIFRPRMILGPGRLGVLKKLFKLIEKGLPVPMIGDGSNCYQMISVFDCVTAVLNCIEKGIPNEEYNLGSENPPTVYELLDKVINEVGSKSILIKTNGKLVKFCLAFLGKIGIELLYKEQYEIADENYIVDIKKTKKELDWKPMYTDEDMLYQAYEYYQQEKG